MSYNKLKNPVLTEMSCNYINCTGYLTIVELIKNDGQEPVDVLHCTSNKKHKFFHLKKSGVLVRIRR